MCQQARRAGAKRGGQGQGWAAWSRYTLVGMSPVSRSFTITEYDKRSKLQYKVPGTRQVRVADIYRGRYMVYTDWVLNSTQSVCIYTPPRDREHAPEAAAAFRTVRSECFELPGLGLVTLRLLTIPLPIRVVEENNGLFNLLPVSTTRSTSSACRRRTPLSS